MKMKIRKGIFALVYKKIEGYYHFAVFERVLHWNGWEINKGGLRIEESYEECIKREIKEETGITDILSIRKLNGFYTWQYSQDGEKIKAEFAPFLVEVPAKAHISIKDNPDAEHKRGFFLNYRDAKAILTYKEQRDILKQAYELLTKK